MADLQPQKKRALKWTLIVAAVVVVLVIAVRILVMHVTPYLHDRAEDVLSSRLHSQVEIQSLQVRLFPALSITGTGIVVRHHGRTDVPPLLTVGQFSARAHLFGLVGKPWHIEHVRLQNFHITIPPREKRGESHAFSSKSDIPVKIDELVADDATLTILTMKPNRPPHEFDIHHLEMHDLGPGQPAPFEAALTNAAPPGEIEVKGGKFGPWQADDPRTTPVSANYTFSNADLSVFKGVAGLLSSEGKFGGPLEELHVEGETTVPDFSVDTGGHPMMLKTEFTATVDGTNGDTLLHPVIAHFGDTTLLCKGSIVKPPEGGGKEILLDVTTQGARIQDLLWLTVKSDKPLLTGEVNFHTKFELPTKDETGRDKVMDRLKLAGSFGIANGEFTKAKVQQKIEGLSQRAQGHPDEPAPDNVVSQLNGKFGLDKDIISFPNLGFSVPGANVKLHGTYGLRSEKIDFHGKVRLQAKPSQMVKGFKSILLKPFDFFFHKNGVTELPIKVTGERDHPSFGLDFGQKDDHQAQKQP